MRRQARTNDTLENKQNTNESTQARARGESEKGLQTAHRRRKTSILKEEGKNSPRFRAAPPTHHHHCTSQKAKNGDPNPLGVARQDPRAEKYKRYR